jgi:hypothetical protein
METRHAFISSLTTLPVRTGSLVPRLPTLLASSVIRGSRLGESHGGLYLVDLERGVAELKLDWNTTAIDIGGRGGDRGLRGIAFHGERILVATNAELLILDQSFRVLESFTNSYLRHCHEISVVGDRVYMTATGFDSLLAFDLTTGRFVDGWHLGMVGHSLGLNHFNPSTAAGPAASHDFHLNSVHASATGIWFSGLNTPGLLHMNGKGVGLVARLPRGTHNAQLWNGGLLYNDTESDRICHLQDGRAREIAVPDFDPQRIVNLQRFGSAVARPRFARGLCVLADGLVAGGSSPSTLSVYDLRAGTRLTQQNLSMDVRNAVHGLAVWPYS